MTKPQDGPAPNYDNNTLIEFDVGDEGAPILVSIVDSERDISIMDTQIDLQDVQDASFPKGEFWLNARENDPSAPKLRIQVAYKTNSIYRHQMHIENLEEDLRNDVATLQQVRAFIVQLRNPFGFLKYDID